MLVEHSGRAPRLEMVSFKKLNKGTLALGVVFKVSATCKRLFGSAQAPLYTYVVMWKNALAVRDDLSVVSGAWVSFFKMYVLYPLRFVK